MIKRITLLLILLVLTGLFWYALRSPLRPEKLSIQKDFERIEINGIKVIGIKKGEEKEELRKIKVKNIPSKAWVGNLKDSLQTQAGDSLKDIKIDKVDSFVWAQGGVALFVESLIVTLTHQTNEQTTFRLLVDSQTGKILENWDRPVFDPANPRDGFKVKIDPRYLEN